MKTSGGAPAKNNNAKKSFEKFFKDYTWAKDETAVEGEQRKELAVQVDKLVKASSRLKPNDPRHPEAYRLLAIMRKKVKEAAEREGRYTKKAVAVDEAGAQLEQCDESQEVLQAELTKLGKSMLKTVEKLGKLQHALQYQHEATSSAGRSAVQVANELLAGEPDEPVDEPTEEPAEEEVQAPLAKRPRTEVGAASARSGGDERGSLMLQTVPKLRAICKGASPADPRPVYRRLYQKTSREEALRPSRVRRPMAISSALGAPSLAEQQSALAEEVARVSQFSQSVVQ